jgi:hypothetical protein
MIGSDVRSPGVSFPSSSPEGLACSDIMEVSPLGRHIEFCSLLSVLDPESLSELLDSLESYELSLESPELSCSCEERISSVMIIPVLCFWYLSLHLLATISELVLLGKDDCGLSSPPQKSTFPGCQDGETSFWILSKLSSEFPSMRISLPLICCCCPIASNESVISDSSYGFMIFSDSNKPAFGIRALSLESPSYGLVLSAESRRIENFPKE